MEYLNALGSQDYIKNDAEILTHLLSPLRRILPKRFGKKFGKISKVFYRAVAVLIGKNSGRKIFPVVVQFNGKTRGMIAVSRGIVQEDAEKIIAEDEKLKSI